MHPYLIKRRMKVFAVLATVLVVLGTPNAKGDSVGKGGGDACGGDKKPDTHPRMVTKRVKTKRIAFRSDNALKALCSLNTMSSEFFPCTCVDLWVIFYSCYFYFGRKMKGVRVKADKAFISLGEFHAAVSLR